MYRLWSILFPKCKKGRVLKQKKWGRQYLYIYTNRCTLLIGTQRRTHNIVVYEFAKKYALFIE